MAGDERRTAALESCDLFADLEHAELELLAAAGSRQTFEAGARILVLGDTAHRIYVIASGRVELKLPLSAAGDREVTVDEKEAGAVFAWSALVPPHKLLLSAYAANDVELIAFERTDLTRLLEQHPDLYIRVLRNLNGVIASRLAMLEAVLVRNLQRWLGEP